MSERITRSNVDERITNLNRRMQERGSIYRYQVQGRNGYIGLDRFIELPGGLPGWVPQSTVTVGTKREVADFLHAMMVALDDASYVA